jgi:hypothetical protein
MIGRQQGGRGELEDRLKACNSLDRGELVDLTENPTRMEPGSSMGQLENMICIVARHPTSRGVTNSYFEKVGKHLAAASRAQGNQSPK